MKHIARLIVLVLLVAPLALASLADERAPDRSIAINTNGGETPLVYLAGGMDEADLAALRESAPNVTIITPESMEDAQRLAPRAHGADARWVTDDFIAAAPNLTWVQSPSAGVDRWLQVDSLRKSDRLIMTNMQGVHGPTIAEHAFGMLLTLTRDLRYYTHPDQRGTWNRQGSGVQPIALNGKTLLVVGLGGIGREAAKIGDGFGMRVLATRRSRTTPPEYVDQQGTPADLPGFLAEADVVVLSVPLTDETRGMIGAKELALMPRGGYLVNVARGPVVDTDALIDALRSGQLAGACLDVTDPEPLPADHELWTLDNVVITPHISSRSPLTSEVWRKTYVENIRRFGAGEPLVNLVDRQAGY